MSSRYHSECFRLMLLVDHAAVVCHRLGFRVQVCDGKSCATAKFKLREVEQALQCNAANDAAVFRP